MRDTESLPRIARSLAERIKILRLRRHWSRRELAEYANVNVYSLKRFERTGHISLQRLLSICLALDVLDDFNRILKPRERIHVDEWKIPAALLRKRGRRRPNVVESVVLE